MSKRSLKVDGATTSLFLEDVFWQEVQLRAEREGLSNAEFIRRYFARAGDIDNRSAAIKTYLIAELRRECTELQRSNTSAPGSKWLVEEDGVRSRVEFGKTVITLGRSASCDIQLKGRDIALKQAMFVYEGSEWWAVNLEQSLQISVNDKPASSARLRRGSEVRISKYQIIKG